MQNTNNRGGVAGEPRFPADEMYVTKRDGQVEIVSFDKILRRIKSVGTEVGIKINYTSLAMKVIDQLYDKISTAKIDELTAEQCASMSSIHYDYGTLAARVAVSNHHKNTDPSFTNVINRLYNFLDKNGNHSPLVSDDLHRIANQYEREIQEALDFSRDYLFDYFGFKTLEKSYLMRINGQIVERPQHMWMRVSLGIHCTEGARLKGTDVDKLLEKAIESYNLMSQKYFTHATPTLFNSGTPRPQMSSCYLIAMENDSIDGIYNTLKDCALISKWAGGIGLHIHNVRATNSHIRGTNGTSNGIVPMLRVFNNTAKYVDQGGGRRHGSFAIYLEPWHADIEKFLEMRKNHGDEELKARDLFYALWIPDLFMERVKADSTWTLMCPDECPGLADVYGPDFTALYSKYESEGKGRATIKARDLWLKVLDAQMETGTPYLCYKDASNQKSNQKNIGTIKSSNLCVAPETLVLTDQGNQQIDTLVGKKVNVWNGEEWSEVEVFKTGTDQELIDVYTDDGSKITCTPYHKFYIQPTYSQKSIQQINAVDLKPNDKIIKCSYPIINGTENMLYAYTHGFFCGDGTYNISNVNPRQCEFKTVPGHYFCTRHIDNETDNYINNNSNEALPKKCAAMSYVKKPIIYLYGNKKQLISKLNYRTASTYEDRISLILPIDIPEKFTVPSDYCTMQNKLDWFAGYCDADGSISNNGDNQQLQVASINKDFLNKVKLMLQTCGINPKVKLSSEREKSLLPDGHNGLKYYNVKPIYRLLITSVELQMLCDLGFKPHRLIINKTQPQRDAKKFTKILKVENNNRIDDTYCFTEPKRHMGVFNGILTGQCTEINEVSTPDETAVCNLASIGLPTFIEYNDTGKGKGGNCVASESEGARLDAFAKPTFNYEKLKQIAKVVTNNLNRVIDVNYYPTQKTQTSNLKHRPIGIGVQGLADVYALLDLPFYSDEAKDINKRIFETIYYGALEQSMELAKKEGPYETFEGSPASQGILQFDMWQKGVEPQEHSSSLDWASLKANIVKYGLRNSLLIAPMPTASTSQILGFNECFEPFTSNIYSRRTLAGEFVLTNKYLMKELIAQGLWNTELKNNIIANQGSIQHITTLSEHMRNKYKTVWEIPMRHIIDMAADRGQYICQSQSMNLWQEDPTYASLTSMHFYAWQKGLKTGIYYLRRRAKHRAQQFTIEPKKEEECLMCSA